MNSNTDKDNLAEIGIVFLHGIGNQLPGEMLTSYGDPFIRFLKRWIEKEEFINSSVSIKELIQRREFGLIVDHFEDIDTKAKIEIEQVNYSNDTIEYPSACYIKLSDGVEAKSENWIFCESYWANSFPKPNNREVTIWLIRVVPWIGIFYLFEKSWINTGLSFFPREMNKITKVFYYFISFIIGFFNLIIKLLLSPIILIFECVLLLLLIIEPIKITFIQNLIEQINNAISSIIGDSYIFTSSPIRRTAIISKVEKDIRWLEKRCKKVILMAHSQGAAIAYHTLKKHNFDKLRLWVTFGSGLIKLFQLDENRKRRKMIINFFSFAIIAIFLIFIQSLFSFFIEIQNGFEFWSFNFYSIIAFIIIYLIFSKTILVFFKRNSAIKNWSEEFSQDNEKFWLDLFTSKDPVPSGKLELSSKAQAESIEIKNENSILSDHTTYNKNIEGFYCEILKKIDYMGLTQLTSLKLSELDKLAMKKAKWLRWEILKFRSFNNYLLLASLMIAIYGILTQEVFSTSIILIINSFCQKWGEISMNESIIDQNCLGLSPIYLGVAITFIVWILLRYLSNLVNNVSFSFSLMSLFERREKYDDPNVFGDNFMHFIILLIFSFLYRSVFSKSIEKIDQLVENNLHLSAELVTVITVLLITLIIVMIKSKRSKKFMEFKT